MIVKYKKIIKNEEILKILKMFDSIFNPNLSLEIKDMKEYSIKLENYSEFYIFFNEEKIVGFMCFYLNSKTKISYLSLIAIVPKNQNRKIGRELINLYEKISREKEMNVLKLEVFSSNKKAIQFYKNVGFTITEIKKEKIIMTKVI